MSCIGGYKSRCETWVVNEMLQIMKFKMRFRWHSIENHPLHGEYAKRKIVEERILRSRRRNRPLGWNIPPTDGCYLAIAIFIEIVVLVVIFVS